jgi:hypothetical protein
LYGSPNIINVIKSRRMILVGHVARIGELGSACNILVGKPEGKRLIRRHKRRWEDNIRTDLREIGLKIWIGCIWLKMRISGGIL